MYACLEGSNLSKPRCISNWRRILEKVSQSKLQTFEKTFFLEHNAIICCRDDVTYICTAWWPS